MESIDLELGELFDRDAVDEDAGDDVGGNADEANPEEQEGDEVLSNLKKLSKGAAKKKVTRPQPKLDAQRLKSDRGLPCLPQLFKDDQFSGKGHEPEDLKLLMSKLEHWAHRLFPKMSFDDFIERLEKLGAKKEIQTCVKRIRLDMPMLDSDFISTDVGADKPDDEENMLDAEAAYDAMIESELANQRNRTDDNASVSDRTDSNDFTTHDIESPERPAVSTTQSKTPLSSDVQRRIEQNRLLALQKRAARLALQNSQTSSDNVSFATAEPSSSSPTRRRRSMETETQHQRQDDSVLDSSLHQSSDINYADSNCRKDMRTADELLNDMDSGSE